MTVEKLTENSGVLLNCQAKLSPNKMELCDGEKTGIVEIYDLITLHYTKR